jgi:hypothetical protein
MPSTETTKPAPTPDASVPEKRLPQRDGMLLVLIVGVVGLLTVAWFCLLVFLGWWVIRAVA